MCVSVCACMCARMPQCVQVPLDARRGSWMLWRWSYGMIMSHPARMLETEPGSSERAENAPNCAAILQPLSPVLTYFHI